MQSFVEYPCCLILPLNTLVTRMFLVRMVCRRSLRREAATGQWRNVADVRTRINGSKRALQDHANKTVIDEIAQQLSWCPLALRAEEDEIKLKECDFYYWTTKYKSSPPDTCVNRCEYMCMCVHTFTRTYMYEMGFPACLSAGLSPNLWRFGILVVFLKLDTRLPEFQAQRGAHLSVYLLCFAFVVIRIEIWRTMGQNRNENSFRYKSFQKASKH